MIAEVRIVDLKTRETLAASPVECSSEFGSEESMTATFARRVKNLVAEYKQLVAAPVSERGGMPCGGDESSKHLGGR
jgi:hypothetical protein